MSRFILILFAYFSKIIYRLTNETSITNTACSYNNSLCTISFYKYLWYMVIFGQKVAYVKWTWVNCLQWRWKWWQNHSNYSQQKHENWIKSIFTVVVTVLMIFIQRYFSSKIFMTNNTGKSKSLNDEKSSICDRRNAIKSFSTIHGESGASSGTMYI